MIQKHLYILKEDELILLSDIIKLEQKNEFEISINECGMDFEYPKNLNTGFRFIFIPKHAKENSKDE